MGRQQQTARRGGRTETVTIAAGVRRDFIGLGDKVRCLSATADLVLFIDSTGERILFRTGIAWQAPAGDDFTQFALVNEGGLAVTVVLFYGYSDVTDTRATISGSLSQPNSIRTTVDTAIAVNATLDVAADTARRTLIIYNNSAVETLKVGDVANTSDVRGVPLPPASFLALDTAAAVRIRNKSTAAGAATVSIVELFEA